MHFELGTLYSACYRMYGSSFFYFNSKCSIFYMHFVLGILLYVWFIFIYFNSKCPVFYMHFDLGTLYSAVCYRMYGSSFYILTLKA
jgi:hypothetical protein